VLDRPEWWQQLDAARARFRAALEQRKGLIVPGADEDGQDEGEAWPTWQEERGAILQPGSNHRASSGAPMIRHYVGPKGVVIFDHRHNAVDRVERRAGSLP
jgi:hypothetical protein